VNRPWMPFYIADYLADTGHLSTMEHGAYLLLIFHYWQNNGIPSEDTRLARIARVSAKEWKAMKPTIGAFFDEDWKHVRIEREIADSIARYERRASAGSQGGNARAMLLRGGSNAKPMPQQKRSNAQAYAGDATTTTTTLRVTQPKRAEPRGATNLGGSGSPGPNGCAPAFDDAPFGRDGEVPR